MKKAWVVALVMAVGVAGFFIGRHGPRAALQATARSDAEQAALLFHLAYAQPQASSGPLWTSQGMGYLESSMTPFYSLGVPKINTAAPSVEQAANAVLVTHQASTRERRLFALFEREFYTQPQEGTPGTVSLGVMKKDIAKLVLVAAGK